MEAKDEYWDADEEDEVEVKYLSPKSQMKSKSIVTNHNNHAILVLWTAFGRVCFPREAALCILEESIVCFDADISDLLVELEHMKSIVCVDRELYTFSSVGFNRADQMASSFSTRKLKLTIFRAWARHWTATLDLISKQFLSQQGDVAALECFHRHAPHLVALLKSCFESPAAAQEWCFLPCAQYHQSHFDNLSLSSSEGTAYRTIVDLVCDSPFLSFVISPTAHHTLVGSLRCEAQRTLDARRYAKLSVVSGWCVLERNLYNFTSGHVGLVSAESARCTKEECETAERLLRSMAVVLPRNSPVDSEEGVRVLEKDTSEALNVLGLALTCLGCEVPAIRKHEEALGETERLKDVLGKVKSEALRGLAMVSLGLRGEGNAEEAARCMVRALESMDALAGRDHVLSVWLVTLTAFALDQLAPQLAREIHPTDAGTLALKAAATARSKLEALGHPLVAYTCGSSAKVLSKAGRCPEALALAEVAVSVFRSLAGHAAVMDNIGECTRNMERDVDNYRRKARRSTRMGHDTNQR